MIYVQSGVVIYI